MTRKKALLMITSSFLGVVASCLLLKWNIFFRKSNVDSLKDFRGLIEDISEIIIPRTETPGAKDANVADYIINVIENCTDYKQRRNFIYGLEDVENYCFRSFSVSFQKSNTNNQILVLQHFENKNSFSIPILNKIKRKIWGESFFEYTKRLVVAGYCISELGATKGLVYDPVPVEYLSCIPYSSNQKSWATK